MPEKRLIGLTGPSSFTQECMDMVEEFFEANFVLLYHGRDANVQYWLDKVDGVVLAGGIDIHPSVYSESIWNGQNLSKFDITRDCRELNIVEMCLTQNKPILGICRGHQLMGIRYGLGFIMDISNSMVCHQPHKQNIQHNPKEPMHTVKIRDEAVDLFYGTYGMPQDPPERKIVKDILYQKPRNRIWVNSFHHQAVAYSTKRNYVDDNVDVIGLSRVDLECCKEIIELMQGRNARWLSCQWHPEYDWKENTASRVVLSRFKKMLNGEV
jgi:gamma-glutamyl-gamma-aminobutyrate hydrolase PuuD